MTENNLVERLARIEGALDHIVKAVDVAASNREDTNARLARVETRLEHVERAMPQVQKNTQHDAKADGWLEAKEDAQRDTRSLAAVLVSIVALMLAGVSAIVEWFK